MPANPNDGRRRLARYTFGIATSASLVLVAGMPSPVQAVSTEEHETTFAPGQIVVGYRPGTPESERWRVRGAVGASGYRQMPTLDVIRLRPGSGIRDALARVPDSRYVSYAEPNFVIRAAAEPNDPLYEDSWALGPTQSSGVRSGIDTPADWNLTIGDNVTIAIIDSGVDLEHPDLAANLWTNPGEGAGLESNGQDDDGNGYADDWRGWDWIDQDNDPTDMSGHGTGVAGTAGAQGDNGIGVSGVSWRSRLIPLRVLDEQGVGLSADAASAFSYAASAGARVVNVSLISTTPSEAMSSAIAAAPETLFVAAAGNQGTSVDSQPTYPCSIDLSNVLCVAATDEYNQLAPFSNYGMAVDLGAPGSAIVTTHPDGYVDYSGTSAAAPHVSGTAALLWARHREASAATVAQALLNGVEVLPSLQNRVSSGGRVNAAGALRQMGDVVPYDPGEPEERFSRNVTRRNDTRRGDKPRWCWRHRDHRHEHPACHPDG